MSKRSPVILLPGLSLDEKANVPLYRQLYEGLREAILGRELREGCRLPSTRELARELQLSRNTVTAAFEQLLAEGYIEGRIGAGTYVATIPEMRGRESRKPRTPGAAALKLPISARARAICSSPLVPACSGMGAFRAGVPALDEFPVATFARLINRYVGRLPITHLNARDIAGYAPLRTAIAEYLRAARSVRCEAEQVFVVAGSQHGLSLVARVLADRGDRALVEDPQFLGARNAFLAAGLELIPMPVDEYGPDVERARRNPGGVKFAYVTPSHQYAWGVTMSLARRLQLLQWASENGAWVVEDDYDSEIRYVSRPLSSLHGLNDDGRVFYLGTFSKLLFPSLRVGYVVVPERLVDAFAALRQANDLFSPVLYQAVLADFINEGHFARHIRRMCGIYRERQQALIRELEAQFGNDVELQNADAGMSLLAWLQTGVDDREVAREAAELGIVVHPASLFYLEPPPRPGLLLGFGSVKPADMRPAAEKLRVAVNRSRNRWTVSIA